MSDVNRGIPKEVWPEILVKLPVKTLGQCRSVCQFWNALIVSPPFMSAHLEKYTQNQSKSLLLFREVYRSRSVGVREKYTLFLDSAQENVNLEAAHTFPCPFVMEKEKCLRVIGSVNGLICLSDSLFEYTYLMILWNPLIRKYVRLPMPKHNIMVHGSHISMMGFGYDSKKGDYKVVRLVYLRNKEMHIKTPPLAEVYSLRDERWRPVSTECLKDHCISDRWWSSCFLNGAIHWTAWMRDPESDAFEGNCLLLFDTQENTFKRMKLPEPLVKLISLDLRVTEYGGKLSVVQSVLSGGIFKGKMKHCEIWVKQDYKVGSSWSKVVSVDMGRKSEIGWVHCLRTNGELLAHTKSGDLVSYDPKTKQKRGLGCRGCWMTWFTGAYGESLALLDKTVSVKTHGGAGELKRYKYGLRADKALGLEEEDTEASSEDEDTQQSDDGPILFEQERYVLMAEFMRLKLFETPGELMASAAAYGF